LESKELSLDAQNIEMDGEPEVTYLFGCVSVWWLPGSF
jgi:hypothetical protein